MNRKNIYLTQPQIVGYMSVNYAREYNSNLSQVKFLTHVPKGKVHMDLNHRLCEAIKRTTDENDEKISLLLKFITNHHKNLKINKDMFITYRRTLISVMCSAFSTDHVRIVASMFNGVIYLCSLETPNEIQRRLSRSKQEEKFCAWGYKFEQYLLSDVPDASPEIEKPVIENEEFSLFYRSTLGEHEILYGAQIDGMLATDGDVNPPPKCNDWETNLKYLRNYSYVELKTNREIQNHRQEHNFKKHKLLRCWCQCYLANLKGLLVGYRNDAGVIKTLQSFNEDIVLYCKNVWQPERTLNFLNYFLTFVKNSFKENFPCNQNNFEPITLVFDIHGSNSIRVTKCNSKNDSILPEWYTEAIKNKIII